LSFWLPNSNLRKFTLRTRHDEQALDATSVLLG
jgi:hypothetical protein